MGVGEFPRLHHPGCDLLPNHDVLPDAKADADYPPTILLRDSHPRRIPFRAQDGTIYHRSLGSKRARVRQPRHRAPACGNGLVAGQRAIDDWNHRRHSPVFFLFEILHTLPQLDTLHANYLRNLSWAHRCLPFASTYPQWERRRKGYMALGPSRWCFHCRCFNHRWDLLFVAETQLGAGEHEPAHQQTPPPCLRERVSARSARHSGPRHDADPRPASALALICQHGAKYTSSASSTRSTLSMNIWRGSRLGMMVSVLAALTLSSRPAATQRRQTSSSKPRCLPTFPRRRLVPKTSGIRIKAMTIITARTPRVSKAPRCPMGNTRNDDSCRWTRLTLSSGKHCTIQVVRTLPPPPSTRAAFV